ncbi:protein kinase [Acrocarpospora sp. B8E8]|uniref:serine/threonine-protein kinase n=1 Tax=Acrocarpospora sp. B8E8 TaxID=3153572 RepID=UPI00325EC112
MSNAEGRLVGGRYQLIEPIGRGGMGIVWKAHDELLDRTVAVKEVRYDSAMGDELEELNRRTMREARAAGRLTHPNVVVVHDVIEEDGRPWIIMQLVESRSLGQVIREDGPLPPARVTDIGLQVLDALRAAHGQGVLHRDVKPENVLLTEDGRVVLTDFGIARVETDSTMTRTGLVGTPAFIAPERLRGGPAQRESDLWSLGATLYAAVEGRPPHDKGMAMATMHAVLNDQPDPAVHAGRLGVVLDRLLVKEPGDRPSYDETVRLLRRAKTEPPPTKAFEPVKASEADTGPVELPVESPVELPVPPQRPEPKRAEPPRSWAVPKPAPKSTPKPKPAPKPEAEPEEAAEQEETPRRSPVPAAAVRKDPYPVETGARAVPADWKREEEPPAEPSWSAGDGADTARSKLPVSYPDWNITPPEPRPFAVRAALVIVPTLLLIAGLGIWLGVRQADDEAASPPTAAAPASSAPPSGSAEPTAEEPSAKPSEAAESPKPESSADALPDGWKRYKDGSGFSLALPKGWKRDNSNSMGVFFRGPLEGAYLQIGFTSSPKKDAVKDWKEQEQRTRGNWPGYQRIKIESVDYFDEAADWEFTWEPGGSTGHILNRGFVTDKKHGYAILWKTRDSDWKKYFHYFETFTATFKPDK